MNGQKTLTIKRKKLTLPKRSTTATAATDATTVKKSTLSLGKKLTIAKKSTLSLGRKSMDAKKPTLSVGKKSTPVKKLKKAKVAPPPAPPKEIEEEESVASKAEKIDKELIESSEVWANYLPLSIGIKNVMCLELEYKRKYSVNAVKFLLTEHTAKKKYLQNIIDGEDRQNFEGEVTHTITDEQKEAAQARLDEDDFLA